MERNEGTLGRFFRVPAGQALGLGDTALQLYESRPRFLGHLPPQLVSSWGHRSGSLWISGPGPGRGMGGAVSHRWLALVLGRLPWALGFLSVLA